MNPVDIVIRSYYRDWRWLQLTLRSLEVYVTGHRRVVVIMPKASLERLGTQATFELAGADIQACTAHVDDYLGQQLTKLHADHYTDASTILLLDSDQVFVAPCDLGTALFEADRIRVAYNAESAARSRDDGWRRCADRFFGTDLPLDLTASLPAALPRHVFPRVRDLCQRRHHTSIAAFADRLGGDRFCEIALLRGYAWLHEPDRYAWHDRTELLPECRTFWSRAQTPNMIRAQLPQPLAATSRAFL